MSTYTQTNVRMIEGNSACDLSKDDTLVCSGKSIAHAYYYVLIDGQNDDTFQDENMPAPQTVKVMREAYNSYEAFYIEGDLNYTPHTFNLTRELDSALDVDLIAYLDQKMCE